MSARLNPTPSPFFKLWVQLFNTFFFFSLIGRSFCLWTKGNRSDPTAHLMRFSFFFFVALNQPHPTYGCDYPTTAPPPFTSSFSLLIFTPQSPLLFFFIVCFVLQLSDIKLSIKFRGFAFRIFAAKGMQFVRQVF